MAQHSKAAEVQQQFSPAEMMTQAEGFALSKTSKSFRLTLGLSIMAGLFIGLAFIFYTTVTTGSDVLGWGLSHLIGGLAFSLGLIFIVVCGGELFTSTVLSLISLFNRKITLGNMLRTWATVYAGNFIGAAILVILAISAQLYGIDNGQWGFNALKIAQHKLHHSPLQAFSLGALCNLLVCLAMWMTLSTQNIASKVMLVIMPVALFVSTGFEHCVANMFMVPLGIMIQGLAPATFWADIGVPASQFADLTWSNFIGHNLIYVTLGNIVGGGIMVGLGYRAIFRTSSSTQNMTKHFNSVSQLHSEPVNEDLIMTLSNTLISTVMDNTPVSVHQDMNINNAVQTLKEANLESAPVVNDEGNLVGYFSSHDLLIELWCQDYSELDKMSVSAIMKTDLQTVNPSDSLLHLAEYIAIDHDKLYPVTSGGIATSLNTMSTADRARSMQVNRPRQYPVVKDDKLVGMVTRRHVIAAFESLLTSTAVEEEILQQKSA